MNVEQILKLVEAGFTKAEIAAMLTNTPAPEPAPAPGPAPTPGPEPEPEPAPTPEPAPAPGWDAIAAELEALRNIVQKHNLLNTPIPDPDPPMTGEQALAEILFPQYINKKE